MLLAAVIVAAAVQAPPVTLRLQRAVLDLPTRDQAVVVLHGEGRGGVRAPVLKSQRLRVGELTIPVSSPPDATVAASGSRVSATVALRQVGEGIRDIDPSAVLVRWEGLDGKGRVVLSLAGVIDLADRAQAELPAEKLREHYARLADYSVVPTGLLVHVRVLLGVYNPFAFEVVATGLDYRLEIGAVPVMDSHRGGFRLRAAQRTDVLVEQTLPLLDLASGVTAFLAGRPATFTGVLGLRTPKGERGIPILLQSGR